MSHKHDSEHKHEEHKAFDLPYGGEFTFGRPGGMELTRHAIELSGLPAGSAVLDFGCGSGGSLVLMRDEFQLQVSGVDADRAAVNACVLRDPSLNVTLTTNNVLDFPSLYFDAILAECSFSLVERGKRAEYLHEFYCILKQNGKLIMSDVFNRGDEDFIHSELEAANFKLKVWEYHTGALKDYHAQLLMDGIDLTGCACNKYDANTGYFMLIAEKQSE